MKYLTLTVLALCVVLSGVSCGHRVGKEMDALRCAKEGPGTDQAIVDCYLDRGLPYPEGV